MALSNYDFTDLYNMDDPNDAYDSLINAYNTVLNKVIPIKTARFNKYKHNLKPWITAEIRTSIKQRDKIHQKLKKVKNQAQREILENSYNNIRATLHKDIRAGKRKYEREIFEKCQSDSKQIWKNIDNRSL